MKRSIDNADIVGLFVPSRGPRRGGGRGGRGCRGGRNNMRSTGSGRRGFYAPPARITMSQSVATPARPAVPARVAALNPTFARARALPTLMTPPPTPIGQGPGNSRAVVPINTAQDAFNDFRTIRAARRSS